MKSSVVYDAIAPSYARHRGALRFIVEILKRLCTQSPGPVLLEVGCGTGAYLTAMVKAGACNGIGMDPSRRMLERVPAHGPIACLQGHAECLPFTDRSVDMIYSVNVVHHIEDIVPYFREANRVLRPGGVLCTATDSEAIIKRRRPLSRYWPSTVPVELARYHDIEILRDAMTAEGFHRIEVCEGRSDFDISDIGPFREKAYSCLQLISEEEFAEGLHAMQTDLAAGPVEANSELTFLWGRKS
jgi:ubiquinone/menaquinone biosynthesis C-methylase UbiE